LDTIYIRNGKSGLCLAVNWKKAIDILRFEFIHFSFEVWAGRDQGFFFLQLLGSLCGSLKSQELSFSAALLHLSLSHYRQ
jgi:hypothetical protein